MTSYAKLYRRICYVLYTRRHQGRCTGVEFICGPQRNMRCGDHAEVNPMLMSIESFDCIA
jgi:hypothetical protein